MKRMRLFMIALLAVLFGSLFSVSASAAVSYQGVPYEKPGEKTGKYYVWIDKNGVLCASKKKSGTPLEITDGYPSAITNGTYIYWGDRGDDTLTVYRTKISNGKTKKIVKLAHADAVVGFYDNKLFFGRHRIDYGKYCDYTTEDTYFYNLKNKKIKKVMDNIGAGLSYGRYIVGSPNSGAIVELPLKVYNAKTGKTKTLTQTSIGSRRVGKYIYYAQAFGTVQGGWLTQIYRYSLTTGKHKLLKSGIAASGFTSINAKSATYYSTSGELKTVKY